MYPPLTSTYQPDIGADIWLLGFSFIEVAAIAAAVELIVGVLKCRPPGMRINLIQLYYWYTLVAATMVLFAFPPLIAGSLLLELARRAMAARSHLRSVEVGSMRSLILFSSLTVLLLVPSALAHHPFADEFDRNKPVTLTGDVTRFDWMNPHASLRLEGREAGGRTAQWVVELGGIDELTKSGWTKNSLKRGDKVTIQGWLAKDGSKRANADNVKMSGGETLSAASSFHLADEGQFAAAESQAAPAGTAGELPGTASPIPLSGLIGLLSLAGALVARAARC